MQEQLEDQNKSRILRVKGFISFVAVISIVIRRQYPNLLPNDNVTLGLLVVAVLPWLFTLIEEAELPGGWKIKFRDLEAKTDVLQREAESTRLRLDHLLLSSMSSRLRDELADFARNIGGEVELTDPYTRELSHLHNLGYIEFLPGCNGFDDIPEICEEILKYIGITPLGREYLILS